MKKYLRQDDVLSLVLLSLCESGKICNNQKVRFNLLQKEIYVHALKKSISIEIKIIIII